MCKTDALLRAYFRHIERPDPEQRNIRSVTRWLQGNKPVVATESTFLNDWNDLTAPVPAITRTVMETFVESCASILYDHGFFKASLYLQNEAVGIANLRGTGAYVKC